MPYDPQDTIAAIATAPGGAARGIVRLSGPRMHVCVADIFSSDEDVRLDEVRVPSVLVGTISLRRGSSSRDIQASTWPCELLLWPGPRSYTRQPVAELHTLGSPPLLEAVLEAACRSGARLAEPGEFTLRAFLAGRIDLTQAEAVLGVIDAEDASQLNSALAQLAGGLAQPLHRLRDELLQLLAEIEAGLDFVEEDIEFVSSTEVAARVMAAIEEVESIVRQLEARADAKSDCRVVLVGPPNAGKSSLFNALVKRFQAPLASGRQHSRQAIVSAQAGTTRDYLSAELEMDGLRFQLIDTAGIADAHDVDDEQEVSISNAARSHAIAQARGAQLRIRCHDATLPEFPVTGDQEAFLCALTKVDLLSKQQVDEHVAKSEARTLLTSSETGRGLDELACAIRAGLVNETGPNASSAVMSTATRCRESLRLARSALKNSHELTVSQAGDELVAAELRAALGELGKVVGAVYTDDILDRVFSSFCIGK